MSFSIITAEILISNIAEFLEIFIVYYHQAKERDFYGRRKMHVRHGLETLLN